MLVGFWVEERVGIGGKGEMAVFWSGACNTVGGMLVGDASVGLAGESGSWQGNNNEPDDTERSQRADEAL